MSAQDRRGRPGLVRLRKPLIAVWEDEYLLPAIIRGRMTLPGSAIRPEPGHPHLGRRPLGTTSRPLVEVHELA